MNMNAALSASSVELLRALLARGGLYPNWPVDIAFANVLNDLSKGLQLRAWDAIAELEKHGVLRMRQMPHGWLQQHDIHMREWSEYWALEWLPPAHEVMHSLSAIGAE